MRFVPSSVQNEDGPGAAAEKQVFDALKSAFRGDSDGVGFYKFPVIDRAGARFDREPDFVILHKEYGLVIVEVKGYLINHIDEIIGQSWILDGLSQQEAQPYSQAKDQGFFIQSHFDREAQLRNERGHSKVQMNPLVALPNISREEWTAAGFDSNISFRVLLQDDLQPASIRRAFDELPHTSTLSDATYEAARSVLVGGEVVSTERGPVRPDPTTKSQHYQTVQRGLKKLDDDQEEIGLLAPPGPQQIRGIAGSGKTVLLAMKAASMHISNPDWKIALTFNTRSLYENIESLVDRFVAHFSDGKRGTNLEVIHAWGGKSKPGLYYNVATQANRMPHDVNTAEEEFGSQGPAELLGTVCEELVQSGDVEPYYDAILIDEGQDFEPGFYSLCYNALTEEKRLIWAYDEAQNLTNLTAPTPSEIFGTDERILPEKLDLSGSYQGGIGKSRIMRRSYRSPRQNLMIAHTLGMALKHPDLEVPRITTQKGWRDIGYEVTGDFREIGEEIQLQRPEKHSPHPLHDDSESDDFVTFKTFDDRDSEIEYVANSVATDISEEGLSPEDILVIVLGDIKPSRELGHKVSKQLSELNVPTNIVWQGNADIFARDDHVTISRINRAKGNEAAQVYIVNLEAVERDTWQSNTVNNRNEIFVGLTRSRAWCTITGTGETESVFQELRKTIEETSVDDPVISFPAPPQGGVRIDEWEDLPGISQSKIPEYTDNEQGETETASSEQKIGAVDCPVSGCGYSGPPASVAAHVSGTHDADHNWSKLSYSGAKDFKSQH